MKKRHSKLLHGWMFRWSMPLNACTEGYRNACSNPVKSNINLPKSTKNRVFMSIHMRMGDSCDRVEQKERMTSWEWEHGRGRPCIAPHGYDDAVERMTKKYGVTDILLASDQADAIAWAKEQKKHDVHWLDTDRSKLNHGSGWIENRMDIGKEETEGALEALLVCARRTHAPPRLLDALLEVVDVLGAAAEAGAAASGELAVRLLQLSEMWDTPALGEYVEDALADAMEGGAINALDLLSVACAHERPRLRLRSLVHARRNWTELRHASAPGTERHSFEVLRELDAFSASFL